MSNMAVTLAHQHDFVVAQSEKKAPGFVKLGSHAQKLMLLPPLMMLIRKPGPQCQHISFSSASSQLVAPGSISRMN
jgi:hypothetical protein